MKRTYAITPPEALEKRLLADFPDLDARVEDMLAVRDELPWPDWCYLPMAASYAIVTGGADIPVARRYMAASGMDTYRALASIIPWRLHKTIFRFDPDLAAELMDADSDPCEIPVSLLHHMPYPCVYIADPPGIADKFDGLFCFLEWDHRYPSATELRMHYLAKSGHVVALYLHWDDDMQALSASMDENARKLMRALKEEPASSVTQDEYGPCLEYIYRHLNLLIYLCSDEPDLDRAQPVPRRRGRTSVQTASYPDAISVGPHIGAAIRNTAAHRASAAPTGTGSRKRPHIRRAHWHLYWTGQGRTVPRVKWISPMFINADHADAHTTTIRPVKE